MAGEVFISYRRADEAHARRLSQLLAQEGVEAWYDAQVGAGEIWRAAVAQALQAADIFVLLYSSAAAASDEIAKELAAATLEKKVVVPVRLENISPSGGFLYELAGRNWINAYDNTDAVLAQLAKDLAAQVKAGFAAPASPPSPAAPTAAAPTAPHVVLQRPAVAILPFSNLSGDPEQEYFADGVTEDLITALAAWRWFPVIARNSTFVYKGRAVDVTQVGKDLGARYVLEGSVRRAGARVRITAQLIEASTAHHIWARNFDRDIGDIFDLQDEITRAIVLAIEPQLARAEEQRALRKTPENLDAWDLSLQALAKIRRGTPQALVEADALLGRAVVLDGASSYAQSLLALTRFHGALFGLWSDPARSLLSTYEAAKEAVELDGGDWLAHALLGIATLWSHGDYARATAEEEMAIQLNPSAAMAYHFHGCVLTFDAKPAEALMRLEAVLKLDPRFQLLPTTLADIGLAHFLLGDCEQAIRFCERAIGEQADHVRAWQRLAAALAASGRQQEAEAAFARVIELQPAFGRDYLAATYPFRDAAHTEMFEAGLRQAGWTG
jgi:TolB-like protein